ncbi:HAD hydrolase-like protein [Microvirga aerilata]|uniref:HAD hydrolase-like protein n=1 Tax=Microvirga aerilata TaxID=670292 RepID=A0A936ZBA7_9HYPH|nr:HAD hydrolase-like protein [Microvirga aerilata]
MWHNETLFSMTQGRFRSLISRHIDIPTHILNARLLETERRNIPTYGYGIKGFVLSMIETAIEVTERRIPAEDIQTILDYGRTMIEHPVELIEGACEVLETLRARDHELWLITKGDLFDQESKIARSDLVPFFHAIEVLSEKDQVSYQRLLDKYGVSPDEFLMVGNSVRSDVLPVIEIGGRAVHVPYEITWEHEHVEGHLPEGAVTLARLFDLLDAETASDEGHQK